MMEYIIHNFEEWDQPLHSTQVLKTWVGFIKPYFLVVNPLRKHLKHNKLSNWRHAKSLAPHALQGFLVCMSLDQIRS